MFPVQFVLISIFELHLESSFKVLPTIHLPAVNNTKILPTAATTAANKLLTTQYSNETQGAHIQDGETNILFKEDETDQAWPDPCRRR